MLLNKSIESILSWNSDNKIQGVCTFNFEDIHKRFNENKYKRWYQGENFYKLQYGDMKITYNGRVGNNFKSKVLIILENKINKLYSLNIISNACI